MSLVCTLCHTYVTRMYSHIIRMSLVCALVSFVCHSYVLVCHSYATRMYSYVIRMSLVCTRMSFVCHSLCTRMSLVCHSYVLVCHSYVTRLWFYHEPVIISYRQNYRLYHFLRIQVILMSVAALCNFKSRKRIKSIFE